MKRENTTYFLYQFNAGGAPVYEMESFITRSFPTREAALAWIAEHCEYVKTGGLSYWIYKGDDAQSFNRWCSLKSSVAAGKPAGGTSEEASKETSIEPFCIDGMKCTYLD
jgi:hypothetical protein